MDILEAQAILKELSSVGITQVIFDPIETGTRIRGSNDEKSVLVYYDMQGVHFSEVPIGVGSVNALLSRINLFDESKAKIELKPASGNDHIGQITIKQGRRNASYRCHMPKRVVAPSVIPGDLTITDINSVKFDKDYCDYVVNAISAMSYTGDKTHRTINIGVESNAVTVTIFDGSEDSFVDTKEMETSLTSSGLFETSPFAKVLKQSLTSPSNEGNAVFTLTEDGVGVFRLELMDVLVHPMVS